MNRKTSLKSPPSVAIFDPEWWKVASALLIAMLLQTTLLPHLTPRGALISPAFLIVLWYAANGGALRGAFFGLIVGACEDAFSITGVAWTFANAAAGLLAGALRPTMLNGSMLASTCTVIPLTIARYVVFLFIFHGEHGGLIEAHWGAMLRQALLNAGTVLAALLIAARFDLPYAGR
jgi:hypothetical protein